MIRLLFVVVALLLAYGFVASLVLGNWELEPAAVDECTECGEPIPEQRRVAVPTATLCVGCQSMLELQTRDRRDWW